MEKGHWYTDENGHHYFVKEGQSPKEGWEATKRRKMINGGKYQTSEDGKNWKDSSREEYEKYEADEMEFDENIDEDFDKVKEKKESKPTEGLLDHDDNYKYQLLDRMRQDAEYYKTNKVDKYLWSGSPEQHITDMRALYNSLKEKPEWLTEEDINEYERMFKEDEDYNDTMNVIDKGEQLNSFLNKVKENKSNSDKVSVNGKMNPSDAQKMSANLEKELKEIFPGKIVTVGYDIKGDNTEFDYKVNDLSGKSQSSELKKNFKDTPEWKAMMNEYNASKKGKYQSDLDALYNWTDRSPWELSKERFNSIADEELKEGNDDWAQRKLNRKNFYNKYRDILSKQIDYDEQRNKDYDDFINSDEYKNYRLEKMLNDEDLYRNDLQKDLQNRFNKKYGYDENEEAYFHDYEYSDLPKEKRSEFYSKLDKNNPNWENEYDDFLYNQPINKKKTLVNLLRDEKLDIDDLINFIKKGTKNR